MEIDPHPRRTYQSHIVLGPSVGILKTIFQASGPPFPGHSGSKGSSILRFFVELDSLADSGVQRAGSQVRFGRSGASLGREEGRAGGQRLSSAVSSLGAAIWLPFHAGELVGEL